MASDTTPPAPPPATAPADAARAARFAAMLQSDPMMGPAWELVEQWTPIILPMLGLQLPEGADSLAGLFDVAAVHVAPVLDRITDLWSQAA